MTVAIQLAELRAEISGQLHIDGDTIKNAVVVLPIQDDPPMRIEGETENDDGQMVAWVALWVPGDFYAIEATP